MCQVKHARMLSSHKQQGTRPKKKEERHKDEKVVKNSEVKLLIGFLLSCYTAHNSIHWCVGTCIKAFSFPPFQCHVNEKLI